VISRDLCDYFNKRVSVNIGCCGVLFLLSSLVCSVFLIMFPQSPLNKDANAKTSILTEQYNT